MTQSQPEKPADTPPQNSSNFHLLQMLDALGSAAAFLAFVFMLVFSGQLNRLEDRVEAVEIEQKSRTRRVNLYDAFDIRLHSIETILADLAAKPRPRRAPADETELEDVKE